MARTNTRTHRTVAALPPAPPVPAQPDCIDRFMHRIPAPLGPLVALAMIPVALMLVPLLLLAMLRHEPLSVLVGFAFWGGYVWIVLAYLGVV